MQTHKVDSNTHFIIYGAGVRGEIVAKSLQQSGYRVSAFLDIRADSIRMLGEYNVYTPDKLPELLKMYKDAVVVITVVDVFQHTKIANSLSRSGASYIICKNVYSVGTTGRKLNEIFDALVKEYIVEWTAQDIPSYQDTLIECQSISHDDDSMVYMVPTELLFGNADWFFQEYDKDGLFSSEAQEQSDLMIEQNVLYFQMVRPLYHAFSGNEVDADTEEGIRLYFELCSRRPEERTLENTLYRMKVRYDIFQHMELMYYTNPAFFSDNPVVVEWNKKGYFNVVDGHNRIAFLLEKGWGRIPCCMSREDYQKWEHVEAVADVDELLTESLNEYPILHPRYCRQISRSTPFAVYKLRWLLEWMYKNGIKPNRLRILDVDCRNGYYGQCFAKMGANVTALETEEGYFRLCKAVNELMYHSIDEIDSEWKNVLSKDYDLILLPLWASRWMDRVFNLSFKYLVADYRLRDESAYLNKSGAAFVVEPLRRSVYDSEVVQTTIFRRKN